MTCSRIYVTLIGCQKWPSNNKKANNPTQDTLYACKPTLSDKEP
jgi:hypothetical protein